MRFTLTARHFDPPTALKEFIEKKLKRLERFNSFIIDTEIVLSKDGKINTAEGKIVLKKGTLTAKVKSQDIRLATKDLLSKLEKQLERHEEKIRDKKRLSPSRG